MNCALQASVSSMTWPSLQTHCCAHQRMSRACSSWIWMCIKAMAQLRACLLLIEDTRCSPAASMPPTTFQRARSRAPWTCRCLTACKTMTTCSVLSAVAAACMRLCPSHCNQRLRMSLDKGVHRVLRSHILKSTFIAAAPALKGCPRHMASWMEAAWTFW